MDKLENARKVISDADKAIAELFEKRMKADIAVPAPVLEDDNVEEEALFDVRRKTVPVLPMSLEEAILQMNLIGHSFFAFTDADSGEVCVVYKRKEGSYGLIMPER